MNRPFYAFGALGVFLALAVLAVSSTSRSTSVQATGRRPVAGQAVARAAVPAQRFSGIYVIVLPAADDDALSLTATDAEAPWMPSYAYGCGFDRCTGHVYTPAFNECLAYRPTRPLDSAAATSNVATQIKLALHDATLSCQGDSRDCLSHYDAVYDAVVYGEEKIVGGVDRGVAGVFQHSAVPLIVRSSDIETHSSVTLFQSLLGPDSPKMPSANVLRGYFRQGQTLWRGLENAMNREIGRLAWVKEWQNAGEAAAERPANEISWNDYAELFAHAESNTTAAPREAESTSGVQSGRWLLRFAATRLSAASEVLSSVAAELDRAASETRLATETSDSQR